jgi:hypothetical protein
MHQGTEEEKLRIEFNVGQKPCIFTREWISGNAQLDVAGEIIQLQSPLSPGTHFNVKLSRSWQRNVDGHDVRIEKRRPFLFAGFRPHSYSVFVDGALVARASGR